MKIGDIQLGDLIEENEDLISALIYRYNNTTRSFPKDANIGELFRRQVKKNPDAIAIIDQQKTITYAELDLWSDRIARFIQFNGLKQGDCVGAFLERSFWLVATLLGTLKAGAVYLPLNPDLPDSRLRDIIDQTSCRLLVSLRAYIGRFNNLQYECSSVKVILCLDSRNILTEVEAESPRMSAEVWDYTASAATTAIEASGWRHGLGGLPLTDAEISDYLDNIEHKLEPYLNSTTRLLDAGCGAGLTMRRLAPRVGEYVGVDMASGALAWAKRLAEKDQLTHVRLLQLAAHQLASLNPAQYDIILIASVVQSFPGLNYLRQVLTAGLTQLNEGGIIFCSHIWNPSQRQVFIDSVGSEAANNSLFVHCDFWRDWQSHQPRIQQVDITPLNLPITSSLARYSYDVLLKIAPSEVEQISNLKPLKVQADQQFLETLDELPSPDGGNPEAPAYMIFTSGSTGHPKGVEVKTRSLINLLYWYQDLGKVGSGINLLQVISSSFDASIKNYLTPLLFGGRLVLLPDKSFDPEVLLQAIAHHQIHILNPGVPSMFYPVLELAATNEYRELESLKLLALGGEAPIMARLRPWLTHPNCHAEIINIYGPSECTDIALYHKITKEDWGLDYLPPIGKPLPNLRAYILDDHQKLQPLGVIGELYLAGEGLAIGYVGNPEQTAQAFIPDPFFPGQLMYRTGDLAYRRTDGAVIYTGRCDNQLKIRGVRIELEEIEVRVLIYPGVREAVIVPFQDGEGNLELIAYITASTVEAPSLELLREWLTAELPAPMVPAAIYRLPDFPRNPNGKIDRRQLPNPKQMAGVTSHSQKLPQTPITTTEQTLLTIWREVLSHSNLGVQDNFFDAGGHSLKTAVLASRIRQSLGVSFSVSQVYEAQTIVAQAQLIEAERTRKQKFPGDIVHLLNHKGHPLLFCFPPISTNAWSFLDLAQELASSYSVYAFDFLLATDRIQQYANVIKSLAGDQSFALIGYSAGASLAFSVTQHLEAENICVAHLLILDSIWRNVPPAYSEAYIERIVTYYLDNPRFRELYAESGARQRWAERIRTFARVYSSEQDSGTIAAPITLIAATEKSDFSNMENWQEASRHSFQQIQGVGHHDYLLERPHIVTNAGLIHNIINI